MDMNIKSLEDQHAKLMAEAEKLGAQIAGMKDEAVWPQKGDLYWWYGAEGDAHYCCWHDSDGDRRSFAIGNAFPTEAEAQKEVDRRKVLTKLRAMTNGFVPDWRSETQEKWFTHYDHRNGYWAMSRVTRVCYHGTVYFAADADVQAAIDALGDELLALL